MSYGKQTTPDLRLKAKEICTKLNADAYIVYATSTREPSNIFGGAIALDVLPFLKETLRDIGKKNKLALILHTNGGDISAPWPIVSLIREYCSELDVVVVDKALSAGTLISIAGDKIIMGPDSFLSPIDPQAQIMLNGQPRALEVEDVTGYVEFVKTRVGLTSGAGLEKAFEGLTSEIPPTVIGSMFRTHALIRSLAAKMLDTRKKKVDSKSEKQIIEHLTEKLFSHKHLVSRVEAKKHLGLGESISYPNGDLLDAINKFGDSLQECFDTNKSFNPTELIGEKDSYNEDTVRALFFSESDASVYKSKVLIQKGPAMIMQPPGVPIPPMVQPPGANLNVNVSDTGWAKEK